MAIPYGCLATLAVVAAGYEGKRNGYSNTYKAVTIVVPAAVTPINLSLFAAMSGGTASADGNISQPLENPGLRIIALLVLAGAYHIGEKIAGETAKR